MTEADRIITRTEELDDGLFAAITGEIDLSRAPDLRIGLMQLVESRPRRLVIDLSDVDYMDSSGVATLVETLQRQRRHDGSMILCGLQPRVRSIFEIARLDTVFRIVENAEQARTA